MGTKRFHSGWMAAGTVLLTATMGWAETESSGSLVTKDGKGISGPRLRELLDACIPTDSAHSTLIILTQCFGGNMVDALSGRDDTAVVSATSEGERAEYGGYDDDAADGLRPEEGRTSDDLHDEGTNGKAGGETPSKSGEPVSLEPVDPENGPIKSRHILVYAGCPDGGNGTSDEDQLEQIEENFEDEENTTVHSVGGDGTGVWDHPGTEAGLKEALAEIKKLMNADEQFILFVTDHGDDDVGDPQCTPTIPGMWESEPLRLDDSAYPAMAEDPSNVPAFTIFIGQGIPLPPCEVLMDGMPLGVAQFGTRVDLNNNGLQDPGDGWEAWIPIDETILDPLVGNVVTLQGLFPMLPPSVRLSTGAIHKLVDDCNSNGLEDSFDVATGFSEDCNGNAVPDECEAAQQVVEEFFNPGSEPFGWWFLGDAETVDTGVVRLVSSGSTFSSGVAALNDPGYTTDAFEVEFDFSIANPAGGVPDGSGFPDPDGLTFIVNCDPFLNPGYLGYGLGYQGLPIASFAVEFDAFQNFVANQPDDPDSNHVGIDVGGSVWSVRTESVEVDFVEAGTWHARIRYVDGVVIVYATPPGGQEIEILSEIIPAANIPPVKYFGFGSGTGLNSGDTDVDNVTITLLDGDVNGNGILDECEPSGGCEGDANGDGEVDPLDMGYIQARFGCENDGPDAECLAADQNGDGYVDPLDVGFTQARFGDECADGARSCSQSCSDGSSCSVTCEEGFEAYCYCGNFGDGPASCSCVPD